jgi:hypothetical protein
MMRGYVRRPDDAQTDGLKGAGRGCCRTAPALTATMGVNHERAGWKAYQTRR